MQPDTVCRGEESINLNVNEIDGTTYVSYGFTYGQVSSACVDPRSMAAQMPGSAYMPQLELPMDPETGRPARRGGAGSSGTQSRVEIRYSGSLGDLTDFMERQLVEAPDGGPLFTSGHPDFPGIGHFVLGEAEELMGELVVDMEDEVIRGATICKAGETTWPPPAPKLSAAPKAAAPEPPPAPPEPEKPSVFEASAARSKSSSRPAAGPG